MPDLTNQDLTMTDQLAEVENARPNKDGPNDRVENARPDDDVPIIGSTRPPTLSLIRGCHHR